MFNLLSLDDNPQYIWTLPNKSLAWVGNVLNLKLDSDTRIRLLIEMETHFERKDVEFFKRLLHHEDNVIRTRAVCILAEIGGKKAVRVICETLKNDVDPLVRHEAAFALGQLGFTNALASLSHAMDRDSSMFVRHEAAIALGVIGSELGRNSLKRALEDVSQEVRESAKIALTNLDYIAIVNKRGMFSKMTGG
jgi:HEAT repeat protein